MANNWPVTDFLSHRNIPLANYEVPPVLHHLTQLSPGLARSAIYYHNVKPSNVICHIEHKNEICHQYTFLREGYAQFRLTLMEKLTPDALSDKPADVIKEIDSFINRIYTVRSQRALRIKFAHEELYPTVLTIRREGRGLSVSYGLGGDYDYYTMSLEADIYFEAVSTMLNDIKMQLEKK